MENFNLVIKLGSEKQIAFAEKIASKHTQNINTLIDLCTRAGDVGHFNGQNIVDMLGILQDSKFWIDFVFYLKNEFWFSLQRYIKAKKFEGWVGMVNKIDHYKAIMKQCPETLNYHF